MTCCDYCKREFKEDSKVIAVSTRFSQRSGNYQFYHQGCEPFYRSFFLEKKVSEGRWECVRKDLVIEEL